MNEDATCTLQQLLNRIHTLQISSLSVKGQPNISYAPYVRDDDGHYYVFISQLASHTEDLLCNPFVAIMLMEDEQEARQIFARTRVIYHCHVEKIAPDEANYADKLDQFENMFGSVVSVLRGLSDFILFRLIPYQGRFVMGFGQAYELEGDQFQTLRPVIP